MRTLEYYNPKQRLNIGLLRLFFSLPIFFSYISVSLANEITLYSGRGETLVAPLIGMFEKDSGIKVNVRYGGTAALAVLIQEEGVNSPADIYWAQDAGALGELSRAGLLEKLPIKLTDNISPLYKNSAGLWVATSGRTRTLAYSSLRAPKTEHPQSIFDLGKTPYKDRVGWAVTNGSFQAFVTGMRLMHGDEGTKDWLIAMQENDAKSYSNNTALLKAIADGEIDYALVNNYYLPRFKEKDVNFPVSQTHFEDKDIGNMMNIAGVAIPAASKNKDQAMQLIAFLLSPTAQDFFANDVYEHSIQENTQSDITKRSPDVIPDDLNDLENTLNLLRDVGLL